MLTNLPHDLAVPDEAEIVDTKFGRALVYSDGSRAAEPGGLEAFIELADLDGEELEDALLRFVRRHGPLRLCREHQRHLSGRHAECTPMLSEPTWLWKDEATLPQLLLRLIRSGKHGVHVRSGKEIDQHLLGGEGGSDADAFLLRVHKRRHAKQLDPAHARMLTQHALEMKDREQELEASSVQFAERYLGYRSGLTPDQMVDVAASVLATLLESHRPRVRIAAQGKVLALQPAGLLGAMYLELATEITGVGSIYFCSVCGKAHSRDRRPRAGERCYCEPCREAGHPARLAMRDKRRRDAKA